MGLCYIYEVMHAFIRRYEGCHNQVGLQNKNVRWMEAWTERHGLLLGGSFIRMERIRRDL